MSGGRPYVCIDKTEGVTQRQHDPSYQTVPNSSPETKTTPILPITKPEKLRECALYNISYIWSNVNSMIIDVEAEIK